MGRVKRGGKRQAAPQRTQHHNDPAFVAAQKEAERRERILADTRRTAAKWRAKIPAVRKCNFENFKNRFHGLDEKDYAIDVLSTYLFLKPRRLCRGCYELFTDQ